MQFILLNELFQNNSIKRRIWKFIRAFIYLIFISLVKMTFLASSFAVFLLSVMVGIRADDGNSSNITKFKKIIHIYVF